MASGERSFAVRRGAWVVASIALATGTSVAAPAATPLIGGSSTQAGDFPTVVAVQLAVASGGLCTGTLIDPEWVLTAAHCLLPSFQGFSSQQALTDATTVIVDAIDARSGGLRIAASETIPHPAFNISALGDNDIGLVRLATPLTGRRVSAINRGADAAPIGITVDMVGYGQTSTAGSSAGVQHRLIGRISVSCANFGGSNERLLCYSAADGRSRCTGDSGGPSFAQIAGVQAVVSLASFVGNNCSGFNADTRVDAEIDFVDDHLWPAILCEHDGACGAGCGAGALPVDPDCPVPEDGGCSAAGEPALIPMLALAMLMFVRRRCGARRGTGGAR